MASASDTTLCAWSRLWNASDPFRNRYATCGAVAGGPAPPAAGAGTVVPQGFPSWRAAAAAGVPWRPAARDRW
ncbi:hypothetical protein GCM10009779_12120 [Polymorphospora rubra]|uniref:Uncharacterized protein n=1 Tax=Polymorphospora rubra TaxID=338584 RepID=A0A810NAY9_9ACTN|nr:hypothetical protein Prubr_60190 [Polymorphospora rubra]